MTIHSEGPYTLHPHNPVFVLDVHGTRIGHALPVESRERRLANARLFRASYSYHMLGYRLAMLDVEASLYGSDPLVREAVNEFVLLHKQVEMGQ